MTNNRVVKKSAYFMTSDAYEGDEGVVVIGKNRRDAFLRGYRSSRFNYDEYVSIKIRRLNGRCSVEDLPLGVLRDDLQGLKRGLYYYVYGDCPLCKKADVALRRFDFDEETIGCGECERGFEKNNSGGVVTDVVDEGGG